MFKPWPPGGIGVVVISENVQQLAGCSEALREDPLTQGLDGSGNPHFMGAMGFHDV